MSVFENSIYKLKLPIQFFAADLGGGQGGEPGGQGSAGGQSGGDPGGEPGATGKQGEPTFTPEQQAAIDKLIQSQTDRIRTEYSNKAKEMQHTIEQLKNQGKTKEQLKEEAERKLAEEQAEFRKEKSMFYASQQLLDAQLDKRLLPFVAATAGDDEETRNAATDANIAEITAVINDLVKAQVQQKFQEAGYNPGSGRDTTNNQNNMSHADFIRKNQIKK